MRLCAFVPASGYFYATRIKGIKLKLFKKIKEFKEGLERTKKLDEWFHVSFDERAIYWKVDPPGKKSWTEQVGWSHIKCVCFKANDLYESDEILLFTDIRPESYVIPTEAEGGETILPELIDRKLYDAGLAIKAASLTEGMLCYPDLEEYAAKGKTETE